MPRPRYFIMTLKLRKILSTHGVGDGGFEDVGQWVGGRSWVFFICWLSKRTCNCHLLPSYTKFEPFLIIQLKLWFYVIGIGWRWLRRSKYPYLLLLGKIGFVSIANAWGSRLWDIFDIVELIASRDKSSRYKAFLWLDDRDYLEKV